MRLSLVFAVACVACSSDVEKASVDSDETSPQDTGDTGDTGDSGPQIATFTPTTCGAEPYALLPLDQMGELVEHEQDVGFSLPAAAIDALLDSQGLGDLLEARYDVELHKVRHLTQDRGQLVETTGYVAFPVLDAPAEVPTMLWLHPTMGFGDACAPSSGSIEGAAFPVLAATQGYAVAAPDYLGMNGWGAPSDRLHPWVVGEPTALASLDSLRATARLAETLGTAATPDLSTVVAFGASQGGHAALMADLYARDYAPEVGFVGVVASIPVTDLVALAEFGMTTTSEASLGLAGGVVTGWDWYGRTAELTDVLTPAVAELLPEVLGDACSDFGELVPGIDSPDDIYTEAALQAGADGTLLEWSPWGCYLAESSLLRNTAIGRPSMTPKLVVTGSEDTLAWSPPVRSDAEALCDAGVPVELIECEGLGHVDAAVQTLPIYLEWAQDRIAGVPVDECTLNEPAPCEF